MLRKPPGRKARKRYRLFKPTMKKTAFILITILLSSFVGLNDKTETGFSKTCQELAKVFNSYDHGHLVYNKRENKYIQSKDFADILLNISKHDLKDVDSYRMERKDSGNIQQVIWTDEKSDNVISVERRVFVAIGDKSKGITITDYKINRKTEPTYLQLRLIENEFEELTIDQINYHSFFESRLVGADEAIKELSLIGN